MHKGTNSLGKLWVLYIFTLKPPAGEVSTQDAVHSWIVQYEVVGSEGKEVVVIIDNPDSTTHVLTVDKGTPYRVHVAGKNMQGRESWSPYMMVETPVDRKWISDDQL